MADVNLPTPVCSADPPRVERQLIRVFRKLIDPDPNNPRVGIDALRLAMMVSSLKANGQQVPVIIRRHPAIPGRYILVDGFVRWTAFPQADIEEMEAVLLEGEVDEDRLQIIKLTLGVTSTHLNANEIADGAAKLMRSMKLTQDEVAEMIAVSPATISKAMSIKSHLAEQLKPDLDAGVLGFTHAAYLAQLKDDFPYQIELADLIKKGRLTRDALIKRVRERLGKKKPAPKKVTIKVPGAIITFTTPEVAAARAALAKADAGLAKLEKNNLPLDTLPNILKNPPQP